MTLIPWDEKRDLMIGGSAQETLLFCAHHFVDSCHAAISVHGNFFIALSGGSTPKALFQLICHPPYSAQIPWDKVFVFWSDERSVPPDHPDSNYHMAMQAGFDNVPLPSSHIYRMHADEDIVRNARVYEEKIERVLKGRVFDLIMLGMGEDGHTASLFPATEALKADEKRLVVANYVPQQQTWRMTMTFTCINRASHAVFYVLGASKQKILTAALEPGTTYPCQRIGTPTQKALWIVDTAAAALVKLPNN